MREENNDKILLTDFYSENELNNITPRYNRFLLENTPLKYYQAKKIIVSDCDGVLTDGTSIVGQYPNDYTGVGILGKFAKVYGSYDKEAIKFMQDMKWDFEFVTADKEGFHVTDKRINHLIKKEVLLRNGEGRKVLIDYLANTGYSYIVFVGDSLSDLETLYSPSLNFFCYMPTIDAFHESAKYIMTNHLKLSDEEQDRKFKTFTSKVGAHGGFAENLYGIHKFARMDF